MNWGMYLRSKDLVDKGQLDVLLNRYVEYDWTLHRNDASFYLVGARWADGRFYSYEIREITDDRREDSQDASPETRRSTPDSIRAPAKDCDSFSSGHGQ